MKRAAIVLFVLFGSAGVLLLSLLFAYLGITAGAGLEPEKLTLDTACIRIYDEGGKAMETARRKSVAYESFPDYLPNAFVAVEDKRFFAHGGIDYRRVAKAMWKNLTSFSFREGASTISQQLIKNTHLTSDKTITRKLKEFKLTRALERRYSKEEILELYVNSIYFGHSAFGVGRAAEYYFGKDAEELTPAECAMLAALVKSPNTYSPFKNPEKCLSRRNFVLKLMLEQGYLTTAQYAEAAKEPLPSAPSESGENAYLSRVYEELAALFPDARTGELGSLKIYTAYNAALQAELEKTEAESDAAALVLDNRTHAIKAYHTTCGTLKRLPASVIKPLLVYAPAIEENLISPATPLSDERADFGGYSPDDAGGASGGYMSARYALSHSVNIPAVRILNSLGCDRAARYMAKMGLPVEEEDRTLALALGGMREGYSLPALADAYSTFASGGTYYPASCILRVEDEKGHVLYRHSPAGTHVFSGETCALMSDMLQTAAKEGTAKKLASLPFPVCAKTGTAEGKGGNTDAYTVAYTAEDTVAVWLGNRDNSPISATGGGLPANIALRVLRVLYDDRTPAPLPACNSLIRVAYDRLSYENDHKIVLADPSAPVGENLYELFRPSALPQETCRRFSEPTISEPRIFVKNGAVYIVLCQTKYYDYVVKRVNRGQTTTIYSGKFQKLICDNSVRAGESYVYSVTPYYLSRAGKTVTLPSVRVEAPSALPDDWW